VAALDEDDGEIPAGEATEVGGLPASR
jgi:hypothetical protein